MINAMLATFHYNNCVDVRWTDASRRQMINEAPTLFLPFWEKFSSVIEIELTFSTHPYNFTFIIIQ